MVLELQPKDTRNYFMLPQAPEEAGYYVYGIPGRGAFQYAHPAMMSAILLLSRQWQAIDKRKFGIGNISLAGGVSSADHGTHRSGLEVDVRAIRKDGLHLPVSCYQPQYDHDATAALIALFFSYPGISSILFNGPKIANVKKWPDHNDHFHVVIRR